MRRDHPRSRGGNCEVSGSLRSPQGPSPLARGKRRRLEIRLTARGTIPARAGETRPAASRMRPIRDHPRSRGGNQREIFPFIPLRGPSPLARGKPRCKPCGLCFAGTIPARAGETPWPGQRPCGSRDHPRSRGGNFLPHVVVGLGEGPSPLARGKRTPLTFRIDRIGTIPARAGETARLGCHSTPCWDHPRSRGGNRPPSSRTRPSRGPSPLARGKLNGNRVGQADVGTIPARAGETPPTLA